MRPRAVGVSGDRPTMEGAFACPECGGGIAPSGLTPGRQVRCVRCATLVEVPFLPRSPSIRRRRRRRRRLWRALAVLAGVLAVLGLFQIGRGLLDAGHRAAVDRRLEAARLAERAGRLAEAFADADAARGLARLLPGGCPEAVSRYRAERARADVDARLDEAAAAVPEAAVDRLATLRDRAAADPDLAPLRGRVERALALAYHRQADALLDEARRDLDAGRPAEALERCRRVVALPVSTSSAPAEARDLAARLVRRFGVVVEPVHGRFRLGSDADYAEALALPITEALRARGYLLPPGTSPFRDLWPALAATRLSIQVHEAQPALYQQSPNYSSQIEVTLALRRDGLKIWENTALGRTRVPPQGMSSYEAGLIGLARQRDSATERLLYDDARAALRERIGPVLAGLPAPPESGPVGLMVPRRAAP